MTKNFQGILWALLATGFAAGTGALVKFAAVEFHVLQIIFFRQLVVFVSALPGTIYRFPDSLKTQNIGLHALRLAAAFTALSAGFWALSSLPLTTAIVLNFSKVFFVTLLAFWFLNEQAGPHRIAAVFFGFVGVLIVIRPDTLDLSDLNALVAVIGAFSAAIAAICVRHLSQTESTVTLLMYQALIVGTAAGGGALFFWVTPNATGLAVLIAIGISATFSQWLAIKSLRLAEASIIATVGYTRLVYASLLGYVFFAEIPDLYTFLGAAVIIGAALYTMHREARAKYR